jgi:hypothetical protein
MIKQFPWYDSTWLTVYTLAKDFIRQNHPEKLNDFVRAFDVFRTNPDFSIKKLPQLFDEMTIVELKKIASEVELKETDKHEIEHFGRLVVRGLPYVDKL